MDFKVDGKPITVNAGLNPEYITRKMNKLKDGEMFTTSKISEYLGVSGAYVRDHGAKLLNNVCVRVGGKFFWANEKTIKAYKAKLNE